MKRFPLPPGFPSASLCLALALLLAACAAPAPRDVALQTGRSAADRPPVEWALVLHGGAGTIPRDIPAERKRAYLSALRDALSTGADALGRGERALDVVERVVNRLEDDPLFNAGRGAVYTHEGRHELDAAIMDGRDLSAGAVAAVTDVKNPVSLARLVMERSPHILLVGSGAEAFAGEMGVVRVPQEYFHTEQRRRAWQRALERQRRREGPERDMDTVGVAALDVRGDLAAATSTGGLTNKRWGRVGDVPIVGAGTYADNRTCALSATGKGEEFIRHGVAFSISKRMELLGEPLRAAAEAVIHGTLQPGDGGVIGVDSRGETVTVFNSAGMYRGRADSTGLFEVGIWDRMEP